MRSVQSQFDIFGSIKDPDLAFQYIEANYLQTPMYYYALVSIVYFLLVPAQIYNLHSRLLSDEPSGTALLLTIVIGIVVALLAFICSIILISQKIRKSPYKLWMTQVLRFMILCAIAFQIARYLQINVISDCDNELNISSNALCDKSGNSGSSLIMITAPIFLTVVLREYRFLFNLFCFLVSSFTLMAVTCVQQNFSLFLVEALFTLAGAFLLYDSQIQSVSMFLLNNKIQQELDENEKHADQIHADEMRHMIANVAHDLKTPLTSFMTGMDLIYHVVSECQQKAYANQMDQRLLFESLHSISSCLENVRNTNTFMLMTINRCLDYTKASKGMKLVPRYETIDLMDTLQLPLSCMKNIQHRMEIILNPLPKGICPHIITDLQWLQENILCLLSNAVKYSMEGRVTISVSLVDCILKANQTGEKREVVRTVRLFKNKVKPAADQEFKSNSKNNEPHEEELRGPESSNHKELLPISSDKTDSTNSRVLKNDTMKHIRFEIEDTGIGMSDEAMTSLFNPFKQNQRLAGGTGLGLYSLAKRVEALNGKYGVRRRRDGDKGSLFWFSFPYRPDESFVLINDFRRENLIQLPTIKSEDADSITLTSSGYQPDTIRRSFSIDHSSKNGYIQTSLPLHISLQTLNAPVQNPFPGLNINTNVKSLSSNFKLPGLSINTGEASNNAVDNSPDLITFNSQTPPQFPSQGLNMNPSMSLSVSPQNNFPVLTIATSNPSNFVPKTPRFKQLEIPKFIAPVPNMVSSFTAPGTWHILLVDDSPAILKMTSMILSKHGHFVYLADNGEEAVKQVQARWKDSHQIFDLVLMDLQMPIMDGLEATRRIRAFEKSSETSSCPEEIRPHQVIIGLSANSDSETTEVALKAGADAFIPKPFKIEAFYQIATKLLKIGDHHSPAHPSKDPHH